MLRQLQEELLWAAACIAAVVLATWTDSGTSASMERWSLWHSTLGEWALASAVNQRGGGTDAQVVGRHAGGGDPNLGQGGAHEALACVLRQCPTESD